MKGLFLLNLEKKDEAYECVRQALKLNMRSHVCWHIYGLLHRNEKNYEEAVKCYKTALRFDPQNGQILKDLGVLQVQTGAYEGLVETRLTILKIQPQVKSNWTSLAVAYHMAGHLEDAVKTMDQFLDSVSETTGILRSTVLDGEMAEVHLYKAMILDEKGAYDECLSYLESLDFRTGDILAYRMRKAEMLFKTGKIEESLSLYKDLFRSVPETLEVLKGIEGCSNVDLTIESSVVDFRKNMLDMYPNSNLVKSRYLQFLSGESLRYPFRQYALPLLKKGAPSLFNSAKGLYTALEKREVILKVVEELLATFKNIEDLKGQFWCYYYLAQHYDYVGDLSNALNHLDEAYKIDSSIPDLMLLYGKVLKHTDKLDKAVECLEHARKMDLGDRYLNSKAVKYHLRVGDLDKAKEVIALFLKPNDLEKQMADLSEIQCIWFDLEVGRCLRSKGDLRGALSYFTRVCKLFDEFVDDQLDFHNYAIRKMNFRYYVGMLRYGKVMYREQDYRVAAVNAIEIIMELENNSSDSLEDAFKSLNINQQSQDLSKLADGLLENLEKFHGTNVRTWELAFDYALNKNLTIAVDALKSLTELGSDVSDRLEIIKTLDMDESIRSKLKEIVPSVGHPEEKPIFTPLKDKQIVDSPFLSSL